MKKCLNATIFKCLEPFTKEDGVHMWKEEEESGIGKLILSLDAPYEVIINI